MANPIEVFVSYSHRDEKLKNALEDHLSLLKRQGLVSVWHDRKIVAGSEWSRDIDQRLESAQIVLLLVSANFLASDYCFGIEMQRALERHRAGECRVIPIILRPVDWEQAPFGVLQALPTNARPVIKWTVKDDAYKNIVEGIKRILGELQREPIRPPSPTVPSPLSVFLCHDSGDKPAVRDLYRRLTNNGFQPWLDEENLLPGQDWEVEIRKAVRSSHVVAICFSRQSLTKSGYVQKEIKFALDVAEEQPDGTIFLIPVRLEDCAVPDRFRRWHWVDLFQEGGYDKLVRALKVRESTLEAAATDSQGPSNPAKTYREESQERQEFLHSLVPDIDKCESTAAFRVERFLIEKAYGRELSGGEKKFLRECLHHYLAGQPNEIALPLFRLFSNLEAYLRQNVSEYVAKRAKASLKEIYGQVSRGADGPRIRRAILVGAILMALLFSVSLPRPKAYLKTLLSRYSSPSAAALDTGHSSSGINSIARAVANGVGIATDGLEGSTGGRVVVFAEYHNSLKDQIQIAIMLNRLYEQYGLRHVAQEGVFATEGPLDSSWFDPSLTVGGTLSPKYEVVLALLTEGELSAAEALTLLYPDFRLHGLEKAVEYNIDPPQGDPIIKYLIAIGERSLSKEQMERINGLIQQHRDREALDLLINANDFGREQFGALYGGKAEPPDWTNLIERMERIRVQAARVGATISERDRKDYEQELTFAKRGEPRTNTMYEHAAALAAAYPKNVTAIVVGAAHSEGICQRLRGKAVPFALIRPTASDADEHNVSVGVLNTTDDPASLADDAFERKGLGRSVDANRGLGSLLDGRRKPPPVASTVWLRGKVEAYFITALLARAAVGDEVTFSEDMYRQLSKLQYVSFVPSTFSQIGKDRIFELRVQRQSRQQPADVWVRTSAVRPDAMVNLETALNKALLSLGDRRHQVENEPRAVSVSDGVVAIFSSDPNVVRSKSISQWAPASR